MATASCVGQWRLFDSTDEFDHLKAREICATCPLLLDCHRTVRAEVVESLPSGTWAGQRFTTNEVDRLNRIFREAAA